MTSTPVLPCKMKINETIIFKNERFVYTKRYVLRIRQPLKIEFFKKIGLCWGYVGAVFPKMDPRCLQDDQPSKHIHIIHIHIYIYMYSIHMHVCIYIDIYIYIYIYIYIHPTLWIVYLKTNSGFHRSATEVVWETTSTYYSKTKKPAGAIEVVWETTYYLLFKN